MAFFWLAQISLWLLLALEVAVLWVGVVRQEGIGSNLTMLIVLTLYSIFYSIKQYLARRRPS